MTSEYGYTEFDASPVRSLKGSSGPATSNSNNRGLAAMPAQERSIEIGERAIGGDQSRNQRQYREAMASNTSPQGSAQGSAHPSAKAAGQGSRHAAHPQSGKRAETHAAQWDEADWAPDQDEAAGYRARRLLSGRASGIHRAADQFGAFNRWLTSDRWVRRLAVVTVALAVI